MNDWTVENSCNIGAVVITSEQDSPGQAVKLVVTRQVFINDTLSENIVKIKEVSISSADDFDFVEYDYTAIPNLKYRYTFTTYKLFDILFETSYKDIVHRTSCVSIIDISDNYSFVADINYGNTTKSNQVGQHETFNKEFPTFVHNGILNYDSGSITMRIIGDYLDTKVFDREKITGESETFLQFLRNGNPKIIKDFNGNYRVVFVTSAPSLSYNSKWGNGMITASFNWTEYADGHDENALAQLGFYDISKKVQPIVDVSDTTATIYDVVAPQNFYDATGEYVTGTIPYEWVISEEDLLPDSKTRDIIFYNDDYYVWRED